MRRVAVIGVGVTKFGKHDRTSAELFAAAAADADLVVVGARGLGALKRLLLGSVSEGVLRNAERSVLIVRGVAP